MYNIGDLICENEEGNHHSNNVAIIMDIIDKQYYVYWIDLKRMAWTQFCHNFMKTYFIKLS